MEDFVDVAVGSARGIKRKAEALDQDVVNKIAAGEIIVAPVHALKELIENAVDAGSTSIEILAKDGGLKLLQITDNGHGINRDDLPILCERFTTSKLKTFEDLTSIGTYGFRGEALASISHIAHLSITTKTGDSSCAWRAHYADGKLVAPKPGQSPDPKPTAGRGGTQITVEDLFYNVPSRQKAFRSPSEEYAKILNVVGRYAVHCVGVAFSCKKHGDAAMSISTPSNASTVDCIRQIHGSAVANELIEFDISDPKWGFKASGWTSNANYHVKKTTILLFINHRSVESSAIKKAIEQTYSTFLPKGGHPFIYLSLDIDPQRVDVNVHPTKREVNFLNEDEIIESISHEISLKLSSVDTSRTFTTQSLLPGAKIPTAMTPNKQVNGRKPVQRQSSSSTSKPLENNFVRTDPNARKITSMLPPSNGNSSLPPSIAYTTSPREATHCRLTTIKELRAKVRDSIHSSLTEIFASHSYVGLVDPYRRIAAIQGGVKLFLVDYGMLSQEYFYQLGLTDFGNFGTIKLDPPLDIKSLIEIGVASERSKRPDDGVVWDEIADAVTAQLIERREMLIEYFQLDVSQSGELNSLPLLVKGYTPSLVKLPQFLMRLGPCVNWMEEKACFHTFLKELASFYTPGQLPKASEGQAPSGEKVDQEVLSADAVSHDEIASTQAITADNVIRLFPDVNTSLANSHKTPTNDSDLQGYDEEQIRLMEEVCIVLDNDDNPIGSASKKVCHLMKNIDEGLLHRAFSVFLFDNQNRLLLQQRASEKITFPSMWTNTCCSHPLGVPGETGADLNTAVQGVRRAAQRKLEHELGIRAKQVPLDEFQFLTRIHYKAPSDGKWGEHEIDYILIIKSDVDHTANANEVQNTKYVTQEDLKQMFQDNSLTFTPWFKLICNSMLFEWWDHLNEGLDKYKGETEIRRISEEWLVLAVQMEPGSPQEADTQRPSSTPRLLGAASSTLLVCPSVTGRRNMKQSLNLAVAPVLIPPTAAQLLGIFCISGWLDIVCPTIDVIRDTRELQFKKMRQHFCRARTAKVTKAVTIEETPKMSQVSSSSSAQSERSPPMYEPRILRRDEVDAAAASLADAFAKDDVAMYFVETDKTKHWTAERRWQLHLRIMRCIVDAHCLEGYALTIGPNYDAIALWMPPGKTMDGWCTAIRSGLAWLRATLPRESRIRFNNEFLPLLHHTKQETLGQNDNDSWYLVYIGTREEGRYKGYCKKLIEWGTKQADAQGRLCYLESSNDENPKIYNKYRFEKVKRIQLTRNPSPVGMDVMVRKPGAGDATPTAAHHVASVETVSIQHTTSE
ncbi:MAG: hypothetical protein Q9203_004082 [Teloschistes exilis]